MSAGTNDTIALAAFIREIDALYARADAPWHVNPAKPPREVKLKRPHWEIGQPFGKGIGIIFGDDISNARLIEKLFNAWPAIREVLVGSSPDSGWRPILNAPKDGTRVRLQFGEIECTGRYRLGQLGEPSQDTLDWRCDCCGRFSTPTGWQQITSGQPQEPPR